MSIRPSLNLPNTYHTLVTLGSRSYRRSHRGSPSYSNPDARRIPATKRPAVPAEPARWNDKGGSARGVQPVCPRFTAYSASFTDTHSLSRYPNLLEVRLIPAKKDIAFVEFADEESATVAKEALHNFKIDGETKMKVSACCRALFMKRSANACCVAPGVVRKEVDIGSRCSCTEWCARTAWSMFDIRFGRQGTGMKNGAEQLGK